MKKEGAVLRKSVALTLAATIVWLLAGHTVWAEKYDDKGHAELDKALKGARVSLEKGLLASQREGKPISGKFEVEEGRLQLSIYTVKGDKFSEVIVDHKTGNISKVEAITGGDDLTAAKTQGAAMAKVKKSLDTIVAQAAKANKGYRPVSVVPVIRDGRPVAEVTLANDGEFKIVSEKLD